MKKNLILLTLSLINFIGLSQYTEADVKEIIRKAPEGQLVVEASRMLQEDYYYFSELVVDKLLTIQPESANYNYRKGFIMLYSRNEYEQAIKHFEKGLKVISKNYDMYSPKEAGSPADIYYHIGKAYHLDEQIDKAVENYNLFITNSRKGSELIKSAELGIKQCEIARHNFANKKSAIVKNIDAPVNTNYPEYSPVISLDGKSLYYTSRKPWANGETDDYRDAKLYNYPEDVYVSVLSDNNKWTEPKRVEISEPQINEATIAISIDERRIYAYQDVTGGGDIFYSDLKKDQFQMLEQVDIKGINTEYWETHCTVAPDGNSMYFVSERPGGYGGRDIYRMVKMGDGSWSEPINLGPNINTAYDEESPFMSIDNKTMYFASNGEKSMGGFDIFVTVRDDNNEWSTPINLGHPINSTGDDLFYTTTFNGLKGYLSSFRKDGKGEKDIYEIQSDQITIENAVVLNGNIRTIGEVTLPESAHVILKCRDCLEHENKLNLRQRDGAFLTTLEPCKEYEIIYMKNATEVINSESFFTNCDNKFEEIYKVTYLGNYLISETIIDNDTKEPIAGINVKIKDKATGEVIEELVSDENGKIFSSVLLGKKRGDSVNIELSYSHPEYLTHSNKKNIYLEDVTEFHFTTSLHKLDIGKDIASMIEIQPIYFDVDKSNIRPDAAIELDKIVQIMNDNPKIKIELGSHTDCRATKAYNMSLSNRRAKASADYIKKRISNPSRIYGKGYGESKLVNHCECEGDVITDCSEEEHQANRRTEFIIIQ